MPVGLPNHLMEARMTVVRRAATLSLAIVTAGCGSDLLAPESDAPALSMSVAGGAACEGFTITSPDTTLAIGQQVQLSMTPPSGPPTLNPGAVETWRPMERLPDPPSSASAKQAMETAASRAGAIAPARSSASSGSSLSSARSVAANGRATVLRRQSATVRVTWSSLDTAVLSVTSAGIARGRADGVATVVARCERGADSLAITVGRGVVTPPPAPAPAPIQPPAPTGPARRAELPRVTLPMPSAQVTRTIRVPAGANLQVALDTARYGDEIVLDAGATYRGTFYLRRKTSGSGWITIRSSGSGNLPAGVRVAPGNAAQMARLVPNHPSQSAINTDAGANFYRLVGLEIAYAPEMTWGNALVSLGNADAGVQTTMASVPTDLVLERMYIHGRDNVSMRRCVALNSARTIIVDSYISQCHGVAMQSQAIGGWNGPGPYRIQNNYLEASSQVLFFGGSDPQIPNLVPSDIEVLGNSFFTPIEWAGRFVIFAQLELKNAQRIRIEGNVFDLDGNRVFSQLWKSVNQDGSAPWSVVQHVTFRNNLVRNSESGLNIAGRPEFHPAPRANTITVENNVFENTTKFGAMLAEIDDLIVQNNTWSAPTERFMGVVFNGPAMQRFAFVRNAMTQSDQELRSDFGFGEVALARHTAADRLVVGNAFVNGKLPRIPTGSTVVSSLAEVVAGTGADRAAITTAIATFSRTR